MLKGAICKMKTKDILTLSSQDFILGIDRADK